MLTIHGEKINLVEFTDEHLANPRYYEWLRDLDVMMNVRKLDYLLPMKKEAVVDYVHDLQASDREAFFAIHTKDDVFIGTTRIAYIDWRLGTGDVGILIGEKNMWGKGLATDVVKTLAMYAFEVLSLRKLYSAPDAEHVAMCKCFEAVGFQKEGRIRKDILKNGVYHDRHYYGLFRDELRP